MKNTGRFSPGWQRIQVSALSSKVAAEYARFAWRLGARGKRGGARVIYYYPKNVSADLTPKQVAQLAKVVKEEFRDETKMFEELLESVREGGAILRGQGKLRAGLKSVFRDPGDSRTGPAATPLKIIAYDPRLAVKAIHQT